MTQGTTERTLERAALHASKFTHIFVSFIGQTMCNSEHVLQSLLKERSDICYRLRGRSHNKIGLLIRKTVNLYEKIS
jgi:hypothetical protein